VSDYPTPSRTTWNAPVDYANEITRLTAEFKACRVDAERYRVGHERYETVRRMNVPEFRDAYVESLRGCRTFDELVDAIGAGTKEPT
jgi:hypothetical protein